MTEANSFVRADGRELDEMRPVRITRGFTTNPAGSVLVEFGNTRVMCTASAEEGVPRFKKDSGEGWLTAEYSMLPAATHERMPRESMRGKVKGRTHEISRLVGRSLRAAVDLPAAHHSRSEWCSPPAATDPRPRAGSGPPNGKSRGCVP